MSEILKIRRYPDPVLRQKADLVTHFNEELSKLASDMLATMYASGGVGLAAQQVGRTARVIVIDISEGKNQPLVLVNPVIDEHSPESQTFQEGCLSFPGVFEKMKSAARIKVKYQDVNGQMQSLEAEGILAVAIQHEIEHLDGKLFIDRMPNKKKIQVKVKMMGGR